MEPIKTKYLPLCNYTALHFKNKGYNFPLGKSLFWSAVFIGGGLTGGASIAFSFANSAQDIKNIGMAIPCVLFGGVTIEMLTPIALRRNNIKAKKGGELLRAAQIAGFIAPLMTAIAVNELNDREKTPLIPADTPKTLSF